MRPMPSKIRKKTTKIDDKKTAKIGNLLIQTAGNAIIAAVEDEFRSTEAQSNLFTQ